MSPSEYPSPCMGCLGAGGLAGARLSENHRMFGVGRDLCGSSSPTPLPKQGHLEYLCPFPHARVWEQPSTTCSHRLWWELRPLGASLQLPACPWTDAQEQLPRESHTGIMGQQLSMTWGFFKGQNYVSVCANCSLVICWWQVWLSSCKRCPFLTFVIRPSPFWKQSDDD